MKGMALGKIVIYLTTVPSSPLRTNLSSIIATFVEQASSIEDLCDDTLQSSATADTDPDRATGYHS